MVIRSKKGARILKNRLRDTSQGFKFDFAFGDDFMVSGWDKASEPGSGPKGVELGCILRFWPSEHSGSYEFTGFGPKSTLSAPKPTHSA